MEAPFFPIIYVRGYAMTEGERDETAADPFCGFNLGSTLYRASINKNDPPRKFIFESPLLRLSSDFGYRDVYENGSDILDGDWRPQQDRKGIPARSVVIYRYYDSGSSLFGDGKARDIEVYAQGLNDLVLRVKQLVCLEEDIAPAAFRCYLVAHSMGGLVMRAFLQNPGLGSNEARTAIDKAFTYATPHNGIEMAGLNVPGWLDLNDINNFNRKRMSEYLSLQGMFEKTGRVDYLPEQAFPSERFFCMVGTNRNDYEVAKGISRTFAGHGSDGLVKVENASLWGIDAGNAVTSSVATAYAYRSHSGYFGIVNSEEAYQNLTRFLFGDVRVDIWLEIEKVTLPPSLKGRKVEALYQFELLAGPRGKRWYLSRRVAEEDSPACRTHAQLTDDADKGGRFIYLSTVFLANRARINPERPSLAYAMNIGIRTPDYQVDNAFWPDLHYEGAYLFRDTAVLEMVPPSGSGDWEVRYGWQSQSDGHATRSLGYTGLNNGKLRLLIPFASATEPGMAGNIHLIASAWNI